MPLGGKHHVTREVRVTKDGPNTWQNVAVVELEAFASNDKLLGLERRAPRQLVIDNGIQLICRLVRETEPLNDLTQHISEPLAPDVDDVPLGLRVVPSLPMRLAPSSSPNARSPSQS